jgi:hypothetical protein
MAKKVAKKKFPEVIYGRLDDEYTDPGEELYLSTDKNPLDLVGKIEEGEFKLAKYVLVGYITVKRTVTVENEVQDA